MTILTILGAYSTIDIIYCLPDVWSRSGRNINENKGDIFTTSHVIFNGLKVNDNPRPKRLQTLGIKFCFLHLAKAIKQKYLSE